MKNEYKILVGITEAKTSLGRLRYRHEDNIKINFKGMTLENYLSQKRLHMRGFLVTIKDKIRDNAVATQKKTIFRFTVLLMTQQPPPRHTETILNQTTPDGICISPSRRLVTE